EVVADPLAVAGRGPAGGEVVVERILRDVAVVPTRHDRRHRHRVRGSRGASVDGGFGDAVPEAELGRAAPLAVADDPDGAARDRGYRERGEIRGGDDLCQRVAGWLGIGEIALARQRQDDGGGERRSYDSQPLGQLELEGHSSNP